MLMFCADLANWSLGMRAVNFKIPISCFSLSFIFLFHFFYRFIPFKVFFPFPFSTKGIFYFSLEMTGSCHLRDFRLLKEDFGKIVRVEQREKKKKSKILNGGYRYFSFSKKFETVLSEMNVVSNYVPFEEILRKKPVFGNTFIGNDKYFSSMKNIRYHRNAICIAIKLKFYFSFRIKL